jgi:hypothetical protein
VLKEHGQSLAKSSHEPWTGVDVRQVDCNAGNLLRTMSKPQYVRLWGEKSHEFGCDRSDSTFLHIL